MNSRTGLSYVSQFFILLGLVGGAFIVASLAMVILMAGTSAPTEEGLKKAMSDPNNATFIKLIQLIASAIIFMLPAVIFARIVNRRPLKHLGFSTKTSWALTGLTVVITFIAFYLSGALTEVTDYIPISPQWEATFRAMEKEYMDQVMIMAKMNNFGEYLFSLIVIAVAPAIFEEMLFRGAIQQLMVKWTRIAWLGILLTSIFFSAVHFSYYGFLSRMALGIILGYLFHFSKSLWLPMLAHFINNGFAVTMMYYMNKQGTLNTQSLEERFPIYYGIIALALIVALLIMYRNESKKLGTYYVDNTASPGDNPFDDTYPNTHYPDHSNNRLQP